MSKYERFNCPWILRYVMGGGNGREKSKIKAREDDKDEDVKKDENSKTMVRRM